MWNMQSTLVLLVSLSEPARVCARHALGSTIAAAVPTAIHNIRSHEHQLRPAELRALSARDFLQVRGGGSRSGRRPIEETVRGGRSSDTAIFAEAVAETALESVMIVGFVGIMARLTKEFVAPKYIEVARLAMWTAVVFLSGAATAGPKRYLETSQLFNIENPISEDWYNNLQKPWWNPPNWLFPIMWVPLKILQVFACYELWDKLAGRNYKAIPVISYAVYKSLGDVWNKVFFERRRLKLGTAVISLYYISLWAGIKLFFDVSERAGYLFAPTAAWVSVATALQWSTWLLNRDQPHS